MQFKFTSKVIECTCLDDILFRKIMTAIGMVCGDANYFFIF
jgi:hypothetical protein